MTYLIIPAGKALYALSPQAFQKEAGQDYYRVTYWSRTPDSEPAAFSYWELEGFFRPATAESHRFRSRKIRSSQYQSHGGSYDVSASDLKPDGSPTCLAICQLIQNRPIPGALKSSASDAYAALEWAYLRRLRMILEVGSTEFEAVDPQPG